MCAINSYSIKKEYQYEPISLKRTTKRKRWYSVFFSFFYKDYLMNIKVLLDFILRLVIRFSNVLTVQENKSKDFQLKEKLRLHEFYRLSFSSSSSFSFFLYCMSFYLAFMVYKQYWLTRRVFLTCQVWFMAFKSIFLFVYYLFERQI